MAFLTEPLGSTADVETLPQSSNNGASLSGLFPQKSSVPVSLGGVAPKRTEFNAIIKILGDALWQAQHGQQYEYNKDFTYSKGSLIVRDGVLLIASEETTGDFDASKWIEINNIDADKLVTIADAQTITGAKTFSEIIQGSVSGSASSLNTPRTISLSGDATGSVTFDGSQDVTIPVSVSSSTSVENAKTATKLLTSRKIELTGDASGSVYFDGSQDVTLNTTVDTANYSASAETASGADKLNTARAITLTGDVTGSASFDGSANVSITSTAGDRVVTTDGAQTITGAKTFDNFIYCSRPGGGAIINSTDNGGLSLYSASTYQRGADLVLYANDFADTMTAGGFSLMSHRDNQTYVLLGLGNGSLTWNGQVVDSIVASFWDTTNGYIKYRSGLLIQYGATESLSGHTEYSISLPYAFSSAVYQIIGSLGYVPIEGRTIALLPETSTTFKVLTNATSAFQVRWIAIGY